MALSSSKPTPKKASCWGKAGKINALAITSRQRSMLTPQVPTVAELGFKGLELEVLYVAMVPSATPDRVVQALQNAMALAFKRASDRHAA